MFGQRVRERESEAETQNCSIVCGALSPLCALFAFVFVPLFVLRVVKYSSSILVFRRQIPDFTFSKRPEDR